MSTRAYYHAPLQEFLGTTVEQIFGALAGEHQHDLELLQRNAWQKQILLLQKRLKSIGDHKAAHIALEYSIPRMGRRVDTALFIDGVVFAIEFKMGSKEYARNALDQAWGYALDLKNFHEKSHALPVVPVLVATNAAAHSNKIKIREDGVYNPLRCNAENFVECINFVMQDATRDISISPKKWIDSRYKPTPNIIEAAQALYAGHQVEDIARSDAAAKELTITAQTIFRVVEEAKNSSHKAICFVTGVPGAGKTLAGLNIANKHYCEKNKEHAVFLSGNLPLVQVLQEALARDACARAKERKEPLTKAQALQEAQAFIQSVHHFRDDCYGNEVPPSESIAIFDEAQRAWTLEQTKKFMEQRRGVESFNQSEPEFLISVLDRHNDWAVIVCLVGSGQEINTGEAGIDEWFSALSGGRFADWKIHVSKKLEKSHYSSCSPSQIIVNDGLHLPVSMRSYRSERVSEFVHLLLDGKAKKAKAIFNTVTEHYPMMLTRDISRAKKWINDKVRSTEKSGIVASSSGGRLKPHGINVKVKIDPKTWFLNDRTDVRSSNFLEEVATEFDIQGLELDWVCVGWDADLRRAENEWAHKDFRGTQWFQINSPERKNYLLNAYRVLLTRARQGMVIFVPEGDENDATRPPKFYDETYNYLRACGLKDLEEIE